MDSYLKYLGREAALGRLSRREFMGRAAALGVAAPFAGSLLSSSVLAAGPQKGGHLKCGLEGGASTDVLDPAKFTSQFCFMVGRNYGDTLVESHPTSGEPVPALAESWEPSPDAKTWTFKIRTGVTFHNGKDVTPDDVVASINYHRGPDSKSAAAGIVNQIEDIKADGDKLLERFAKTTGN